MKRRALERAAHAVGGVQFRVDAPVAGVVRVRMSTRLTRVNGMIVCSYLVDGTLVDAGFVHALEPLLRFLDHREVGAVCLTHHHEDHVAGCAELSRRHDCPIYLRNPEQRTAEGLDALRPYRLMWWGTPEPYTPADMPERVDAGGRPLRAVPIPGHSVTHTMLFDESSGVVFTGDLFITGGVTAVMAHENPYQSVASLRRVAALEPRWMLTGHGLVVEEPAPALRRKADAIERTAAQVVRLHAAGLPVRRIVRRLFPRGRNNDHLLAAITGGEFSRANFVRACLRHAADPQGGQ